MTITPNITPLTSDVAPAITDVMMKQKVDGSQVKTVAPYCEVQPGSVVPDTANVVMLTIDGVTYNLVQANVI